MNHKLKILPQYYDAVLSGKKPFEVRENYRGFQKGDGLRMRKWDAKAECYLNCSLTATITYVHSGLGVAPGYVVLGLGDVREWPE